MVDKETILKILEMHYIEQMTFTEISQLPDITYTRQTVAKICNRYKGVVREYLNTYYNGDLDEFYRKYKYERDGSGNVKFDDKAKKDVIASIKKLTRGEVTPRALPPSVRRYKISHIIERLREYGFDDVSESTLRRFIRKKYKYFDKPVTSEIQSDQNDSEQKE